MLLSWSDELLRRCGLPLDVVAPALDVFDLCRTEVIAGQFLDVSAQARGHADVDTAMTVLRYKSAKYSIERPLHLGAALAGAPASTLAELTAFGLPLGEAFQLRDDLLGVYGDPATTGKPAGDDLVEGKRTVLVALALDGASPEDAALLDRSLGSPLAPDDVERLRGVIDASGAHAQVEAVIDQLSEVALAALDRASIDDGAREVLRGRSPPPSLIARCDPSVAGRRSHRFTIPAAGGATGVSPATGRRRPARRHAGAWSAGRCARRGYCAPCRRPSRCRGRACTSRPTAAPWDRTGRAGSR